MAETIIKQRAFAFMVFDFQNWETRLRLYRRYSPIYWPNIAVKYAGLRSVYDVMPLRLPAYAFTRQSKPSLKWLDSVKKIYIIANQNSYHDDKST